MANFNRLLSRLDDIAKIAAQAAKQPTKEAIRIAYNESKQPGGSTFKKLKRPTGKLPVIGLRDYYSYTVTSKQVKVTATRKPYAVYHHTGTRFMPPRTPWAKNQKIPKLWQEVIGRPVLRAIRQRLIGKGKNAF